MPLLIVLHPARVCHVVKLMQCLEALAAPALAAGAQLLLFVKVCVRHVLRRAPILPSLTRLKLVDL